MSFTSVTSFDDRVWYHFNVKLSSASCLVVTILLLVALSVLDDGWMLHGLMCSCAGFIPLAGGTKGRGGINQSMTYLWYLSFVRHVP